MKLFEKINSVSAKTKNVAIGAGVAVSTLVASVPTFAADPATVDPNITSGFTQAGSTTLVIIGAGVAASVAVIAAAGGAKAGLKWIKGVFAKAA